MQPMNIERHIDVDRLISGKYMDNLELMQWGSNISMKWQSLIRETMMLMLSIVKEKVSQILA